MIHAVELDFASKTDRRFELADASQLPDILLSSQTGKFCWVDFSGEQVQDAVTLLAQMGVDQAWLNDVTAARPVPYFIDCEDCLFFTILDGDWKDGHITTVPVAVFMGHSFMVTVHREKSTVVESMFASYERNFRRIALSPGFLLYEIADHVCEEYTQVVCQIADDTEIVEDNLFEQADETMFQHVAALIRGIIEFYKIVVFSREVIHDLATSRSPFISETTQPFLEKKATLLDRLSADVSSEREVLSESVHLYMGIVTHKTNRFLSRLTVLSTLFLPLTFLAGVYGMNFDYLPELRWYYSYYSFWAVSLVFSITLLVYFKRKGWL